MEDKTKKEIQTGISLKTLGSIGVFILVNALSWLLEKIFDYVLVDILPLAIIIFYILWACYSIYKKRESVSEQVRNELLLYNIIIPVLLSILIGVICVAITGDTQKNFMDNAIEWFTRGNNNVLLCTIFSILVVLCYFIVSDKQQPCKDDKIECGSYEKSEEKLEEISTNARNTQELVKTIPERIENIQRILDKKSQVGYTATCIPIKYDKEHETFVFVLIKNLSHKESQWMFPGSHVEVSDNQLKDEFDLTDISIIPGKIIQEKVKKEAGLFDLQFIDPYYEAVDGNNKQRSYPNTCYPAKTPVFNYLFRVSESAKCYHNQNHRCHYDFTYIGEYTEIQEKEAEYEVVEVEFSREKILNYKEHLDAIAYISSKLGEQINKKIHENSKKKPKTQFTTPLDQLCLDSIPEMIYNAILFYIDYKGLGNNEGN